MRENRTQAETVAVGEFFSPFVKGQELSIYTLEQGSGLTSRQFKLGDRGVAEVHLVNQDRGQSYVCVVLHTPNEEGITDLGCEINLRNITLTAKNAEPEEPDALYYSWEQGGSEPKDLHIDDYGDDIAASLKNLKLRFVQV